MTNTRRLFSREFKLNAIELSYKRENIKELAHELGIRPELLYRWRKSLASNESVSFPGNGQKKMTPLEAENAKLRKQLADMRMERDILKTCAELLPK